MNLRTNEPTAGRRPGQRQVVRRHTLTVRITHWVNVVCLSLLLMSGLQIFNAHPRLYWGPYGAETDKSWLSIGSGQRGGVDVGFLDVGPLHIETTGVLGISAERGQVSERAFPAWSTLPSYQDLGAGRRWHFSFAWALLVNGLVYLAHGFWRTHFRRDLLPSRDQMAAHHLWQEVRDHARLRFPKGSAALRYNALQKLSYLAVIFGVLPLMVLTGLTMSPGLNAAFPFMVDVFGGRPSARSLHFISASLLVLFVAVHVAMVIASGLRNNLRSMVSGRYAITLEKEKT